jgi:hypothetical protein
MDGAHTNDAHAHGERVNQGEKITPRQNRHFSDTKEPKEDRYAYVCKASQIHEKRRNVLGLKCIENNPRKWDIK